MKDYGNRPKDLRDLLAAHHLEMVAFSSGGVGIAAGSEASEIAKHVSNAKFVHDVGGRYLQVTDSARPSGRKPEADDFKQLGRVLTEIGKRSTDLVTAGNCAVASASDISDSRFGCICISAASLARKPPSDVILLEKK